MKTLHSARNKDKSAGFTLVEVMVALAIVSIIIAAMTTMFERSGRLYTNQNAVAALQQEVRAALEIIAQESRMAAYRRPDKKGAKSAIKVAQATDLRFETDLDESGKIASGYNADGECENRRFRYSAANNAVEMRCGATPPQYLIGGNDASVRVTALDFRYLDDNNNTTTFTPKIRGAVITIVAQAPAGRAGMIERSYSTRIDFRNAGPNELNAN